MSKPKPLADAADRARITTDLQRSLLVEAGAGSGKTHEMAARMAAGVAAGVYLVGEMAAVTFTRKAAAELRGRFQAALETELARVVGTSNDDVARRERLRGALSNIERFFSGTIHAFCARLLRERPIEANVAPGFSELDDVDEMLMRKASWREFRARARQDGDADLALLSAAGIKAKDLDGAFNVVSNYEDVEFPAAEVPVPDVDRGWDALARFWSELESHLPAAIPEDTTCGLQEKARRFERAWVFAGRAPRSCALLAGLLGIWDSAPKVTQYQWSDDKAKAKKISGEAKELWETLRTQTVTPWLAAWRQHLYAPSVRLLVKARVTAADDRQRRNVLSFNDLLLKTARLLRDHEDVRLALRKKYRWLFVDEFQDTDPIQAEIMFLLAGDANALFVVGDPKQSIFRFRRADIDIYNQVRARLGGSDAGGVVSLTTNFRSVPSLCNWANEVFSTRFPQEPDSWSPKFAPLDPNKGEGDGPALFTLTVGDDEGDQIARYIRSEVDAKRRSYGDFLILTRKKKPLTDLQEALEALEIPIEVSGAGAFGRSEQVRELSQLLQALADPQDGVALVGVLRGALFGVSDPELFEWRQAGGYFGIFAEVADLPKGKAGDGPRRVAAALEQLRRWHTWTRQLPAGGALDRILEDSGYLALSAATPGGVEAGDLLHAVDRVRAAVENGLTLAEAADMLVDDSQESSEVESWPLEPGRADVVRLMNLHKAKGLEAKVVFLADPKGGYQPRADVSIVRTEATAQGWFPVVQKSETSYAKKVLAEPPDWDARAAAELKYLVAEENRLLYVAATRAQEQLVVCRSTAKNSAWVDLDPFLSKATPLPVPATVAMPVRVTMDLSVKAAAKAVKASDEAHANARVATWAATSVTAEAKHLPRIGDDDGVPETDDPTRVLTEDTPSRRADAGMAWGSLVHGLLEHAMRFPSATRDDLRRLGLWLTVEEPDLRALIDQAIDTVESVSKAEFWVEAKNSAECHEEAPFAVLESSGGLPTIVNGVVDLAYRLGSGWQIVDYKTDLGAGQAELEARYAKQLKAYADAWSGLTKETVTTRLFLARSGPG